MDRKLNITSKNSNEIYFISFPNNLLKFIKYDFTSFSERCIELCRESIKRGDYNRDEASELRSSISPCHRYYEKNMYGVFEKIVIDFWIEYICKQNEINAPTLWNSFTSCRNGFETAVFSRLCEYRYNRAINQWTNLSKIQEYAIKKTEFIFGKKLERFSLAPVRAGYFDLLFNVAANEMGRSSAITSSKVYSAMRTPNSPFIMSGVSREIMRNVLKDVRYSDEQVQGNGRENPVLCDQNAMEVFGAIKAFIPDEPDSITNTIMKSFSETPQKVYIPESFKAAVDLEIGALIESGAVLQRCARCGEFFLRDERYDYDCCSKVVNGRTCLEIMSDGGEAVKRPLLTDPSVLYARCDHLYKEMAERVNVDITQRDFSDWYKFMITMRDNVVAGLASMEDFENFAEYSREISFPQHSKRLALKDEPLRDLRDPKDHKHSKHHREHRDNNPNRSEAKAEAKEVKPYSFEKVDKASTKYEKPETLGDLLGINVSEAFISNAVAGTFNPYPAPVPYAPINPNMPNPYMQPQIQPPIQPPTSRVIRGAVLSDGNITPAIIPVSNEVKPIIEPEAHKLNEQSPANLNNAHNSGEQAHKTEVNPYKFDDGLYKSDDDFLGEEAEDGLDEIFDDAEEKADETKIYGEDKDEGGFVKVYSSSEKRNKGKRDAKESKTYEKGGLLKNPYIREIIKGENIRKYGVESLPEASANSENGENGENSANNPNIEVKSKSEKPANSEKASEYPALKIPHSHNKSETSNSRKLYNDEDDDEEYRAEEAKKPEPLLNFSSILSGIERKDGFGKEEDDTPTSHKTKRVMDAIFGKSKGTNPFVNADEKDEDYD